MAVVGVMLIVYAFWPEPTEDDEAIKRHMTGRRVGGSQEMRRQAKESVAKRVLDTHRWPSARR